MSLDGLLGVEVRYVLGDGEQVVTAVCDVDLHRVVRGLPVRRAAAHAGQRHYAGLFWSATTGGHVAYESRLELDRLWLADFDRQVLAMAAQPLWLCGQDGSVVRRHAPDLLLADEGGGFTVVDVKPARLASRPEVAAVFGRAEHSGRAGSRRAIGTDLQRARVGLPRATFSGRSRRRRRCSRASTVQARRVRDHLDTRLRQRVDVKVLAPAAGPGTATSGATGRC